MNELDVDLLLNELYLSSSRYAHGLHDLLVEALANGDDVQEIVTESKIELWKLSEMKSLDAMSADEIANALEARVALSILHSV